MKTQERELARELRRAEGVSIKEIGRRVGVSASSVSGWVRDIELTPEQHADLQLRNVAYNRQMSGTWKQAANRRAERVAYQEREHAIAREGNPLYVAGRLFVRFLRTCFQIDDEAIRLTCNLFADHVQRQREIERFFGAIQEIGGFTREAWLE